MARPTKPGSNTSKRGRSPSKQTTIDLAAKDVSKTGTDQADTKEAAKQTDSPAFGRNAATAKASPAKPAASGSAAKTAEKASASRADDQKTEATQKPSTSSSSEPAKKADSAGSANGRKTADKHAAEPKKPGKTSGLLAGLVGACIAVLGLGTVGQFEGASKIPLIGSIFSNASEDSQTTDQIAILNARIDELAAASNSSEAGDTVEIAKLNQKIAELEDGLAGNNGAAGNDRIIALEEQLTEISTVLGDLSETVSETGEGNPVIALAGINAKIADLGQQLAAVSVPDLKPLQTAVDALQADARKLQESIAKNTTGILAVGELAGKLENDIQSIRISNKVAKSVALNALGSALQNDDPLFIPISSLEALGGVSAETTRLAELSRQGIPSVNELATQVDEIADNIQNPVIDTESASITDKLWANARNLVTIRTSGPQEGDSAVAILSRIKAGLKNGELAAAQAEWKKLPPEVSSKHADWEAKLDKRVEAFTLYQKLSDNLSDTAG